MLKLLCILLLGMNTCCFMATVSTNRFTEIFIRFIMGITLGIILGLFVRFLFIC